VCKYPTEKGIESSVSCVGGTDFELKCMAKQFEQIAYDSTRDPTRYATLIKNKRAFLKSLSPKTFSLPQLNHFLFVSFL